LLIVPNNVVKDPVLVLLSKSRLSVRKRTFLWRNN